VPCPASICPNNNYINILLNNILMGYIKHKFNKLKIGNKKNE